MRICSSSSSCASSAERPSSAALALLPALWQRGLQAVARLCLLVAARAQLGELDARLHHALLHAFQLARQVLELQLQFTAARLGAVALARQLVAASHRALA